MRIMDVMSEVSMYSPNTLDESLKYKWLSTAERHVREILNSYEQEKPYEERNFSPETDADEVLAAPDGYTDLYRYYMLAQVNLLYGDTAKYNVFAQLYANALNDFRLWCVRTFRSKKENTTLGVI